MIEISPGVLEMLRAGRFARALERLEAVHGRRSREAAIELVRAQLLQQLGRGEDACRIALTFTHPPNSERVRANAHLVLGIESRVKGDLAKAVHHFERAMALAESGCVEDAKCWSEMRLMLALSETGEGNSPAGFLAQVRVDVARLGDPQVTAVLHLYLAQIEAKRGLLSSANRHGRAAQAALASEQNIWLEGLLAINAYCLAYLASDFDRALEHARRTIECGRESGDPTMESAAAGNMGQLYLTSHQVERADKWLSQAARLCRPVDPKIGILDSLAQVKLEKGQLDNCEALLAQIRDSGRGGRESMSWYRVGACLTNLRLLLRRNASAEAILLASDLLSRSGHLAGLTFGASIYLLQSEALLMAGRREEATEVVCRVADRPAENPLETLPRVGRMIAKLHAALGNQAAAREWFEHSARALASTADERGRVEVLEDYADLLWPTVRRPDAQPPTAPPSLPPGHPAVCRLTVHPDLATDLAHAPSPLSVASALAHASTLVDFANRPLFLGGELQEMLRQCRAITDAAIVACADNATPEVLGFWGNYSRLDPLVTAASGVERIALGRWRDKDIELRAAVSAALDARTTVIALKKLARAILELDAARREERERAALWPLDEPVEARHGLFASQSMLDLVATARKIGPSNTTVLITGETGTGKEVLARIIHDASPRAARPFIPFNCAAVPREMLDSQLFGHRRGAFTGALTHSSGVIRAAAGGTLLLDEIGEVTPDLQPKLLRFLEAQEIQPLGEPRPIAVDVRVLASTNADLGQLLASGRFREDLYYRLNVIRLRVPPLRERREEIPMLVQHFLARFAAENGKDNLRVAEETMEYLLLYGWPGNVRELQNQMRRLAALAENGAVLMPEHLSPEIAATRRTVPASERDLAPTEVVVRLDQPLAAAVEQIERAIVPWALHSADGRLEVAAEMLGLSRKGLYLKRRRLGLDANDTLAPPPRT